MEIFRIMRNRCEVNIIFTGEQYIFTSPFYGLLAVANRRGYDAKNIEVFDVYYGNINTVGGSFGGEYCLQMAKAFVRKYENIYIKVNTTFIPHRDNNINMWKLQIKAASRER